MVEINQLVNMHFGGSKARLEANSLKKEVAHLRAIADITDRVSGSNEVYYETFDGTNNMSVGKIDLAMVEDISEGSMQSDGINFAKLGDNLFSDFKIGQEVTLLNKTTKQKYIANILRISNNIGKSYIRISNKEIPLEGVYTICRSMAKIIDNKLHLYPTDMLEHDIRLNIDLLEEDKAYTIVSWVEQETPMTVNNLESTIEDTLPLYEMSGLTKSNVTNEKQINITWNPLLDKRYTAIKIFRETTGYKEDLTGEPLVSLEPTATSYQDTLVTESTTYYYSVFCVTGDSKFTLQKFTHYVPDLTPTSPVTDVRETSRNYNFNTQLWNVDYSWTNPTSQDFNKVSLYVDDDLVYEGKDTQKQLILRHGNHNIRLIAYDTSGNSVTTSQSISLEDYEKAYYGVKIDQSESDPQRAVSYIGGAIGMQPGNDISLGGWENIYPYNSIKPCVMRNGQVIEYVQKQDVLTQDTKELLPSSIQGDGVQGMVEIPKVYWQTHVDGNFLYIRMSQRKLADDFIAFAHTFNGVEKDKIYLGMYQSSDMGAKNNSSNVIPATGKLQPFLDNYKALGEGYQMWKYSTLLLFQILYTISHKNLNCQQALGNGVSDTSSTGSRTKAKIGEADTLGFIYGDKVNTDKPMKYLGVENLWGNVRQWIDGIRTNENFDILLDKQNNGTYEVLRNLGAKSIGTLKQVDGNPYAIFLPRDNTDASIGNTEYAEHFCDSFEMQYKGFACSTSGECWDKGRTGIFSLGMGDDQEFVSDLRGSRVMYVPQ